MSISLTFKSQLCFICHITGGFLLYLSMCSVLGHRLSSSLSFEKRVCSFLCPLCTFQDLILSRSGSVTAISSHNKLPFLQFLQNKFLVLLPKGRSCHRLFPSSNSPILPSSEDISISYFARSFSYYLSYSLCILILTIFIILSCYFTPSIFHAPLFKNLGLVFGFLSTFWPIECYALYTTSD